MEYLVRKRLSKLQQKKGRRRVVAHLWDGTDTLCQMYSTGGIRRKSAYSVESDPGGARLCTMCVEAAEGKHLDREALEAIWRDRGLGGSDLADMMEAEEAEAFKAGDFEP